MSLELFNPELLYAFDLWNQPDNENSIHHHDFFEISIILQGESLYLIDGEWKTVRSGDVLMFNPGVDHAEKQLINTYSHQLHIGIKNFKLYGLEENHFPNSSSLLSIQDNQLKVFDKAWQLIEEFNQQQTNFHFIGRALVMEMMILLLRSLEKEEQFQDTAHTNQSDRMNQVVQLITTYMENNYAKDISIEQLATLYYVSPTYLSKIFKELTGVSPINYLIQIRLKNAHQMLEKQDLTVKEVAKAVGYEDAYHFSKSFKKHFGISPSIVKNNPSQ
ncbi:AraC family transcriptional regulator [Enterococcus eurekensis]|uniref:Helix-turn-helix domain-containing protein n=1 Tax=Enterococcus eurekensis TaxID=1159753 RepID=A0ABV9M4G7_9ENTE